MELFFKLYTIPCVSLWATEAKWINKTLKVLEILPVLSRHLFRKRFGGRQPSAIE